MITSFQEAEFVFLREPAKKQKEVFFLIFQAPADMQSMSARTVLRGGAAGVRAQFAAARAAAVAPAGSSAAIHARAFHASRAAFAKGGIWGCTVQRLRLTGLVLEGGDARKGGRRGHSGGRERENLSGGKRRWYASAFPRFRLP